MINIARSEDIDGIFKLLMENLFKVKNINNLSRKERLQLESRGFLRKDVEKKYYGELIANPKVSIYIAKDQSKKIVGFASIHMEQYNIREFRTTLKKLYIDNDGVKDLLTKGDSEFAYLDQVSVLATFKRKGVGRKIMEAIYKDIKVPIVSFIVIKPLANIASARWHEGVGFTLAGKCDGTYKKEYFEWEIYIKHV